MAISIANYLKKKGHQPIVFRLDRRLAEKFDIETETSVSALVAQTSFLIIGGGGMLVGNSGIRRIFSPIARKFENDFKQLKKALEKFKKNIYPISIGGAGKKDVRLPRSRERFFASNFVREGTLRLKGDLSLTERMGKSFTYFPDILFDIESHFKVRSLRKPHDGEIWIGLNLISKDMEGEYWLDKLVEEARKVPHLKLFFIRTHLENYQINYEYCPETSLPNVKPYNYSDVEDTLNLLTSLDIIISSKLHVGLTSLALRTPFLSFKGKDKTKAQLRELKADQAIFDSGDQLDEFLEQLINSGRPITLEQIYDVEKLRAASEGSKKHYQYIDHLILENMTS